jgi:pyrroline-5-carboxylate reductase
MGLMAARRTVASGICDSSEVRLSQVRAERASGIKTDFPGALLFEDNAEAVAGADLVILSVKPKQFADAGRALQGKIPPDALVVSVMTGVDLASMSGLLGVGNVVRASTNIGIDAGCATTYWIALGGTSSAARELAVSLFAAWGDAIECSTEALLDIAMVGVGSGPALVIEFIQALTQAMVTEGMARDIAEKGILSLVRGTAELARTGNRSLADFQQSVVTPGGITAEALLALDEGRFRATVINAFRRAHEKTSRLAPPGKG